MKKTIITDLIKRIAKDAASRTWIADQSHNGITDTYYFTEDVPHFNGAHITLAHFIVTDKNEKDWFTLELILPGAWDSGDYDPTMHKLEIRIDRAQFSWLYGFLLSNSLRKSA